MAAQTYESAPASPKYRPSKTHVPMDKQPHGWQFLLLADLREQAARRPWGRALQLVGFVHLAFFLVCQTCYTMNWRAEWLAVLTWVTELCAVFATMRVVVGKGWLHESPAVTLIFRIWVTFLILSFNVATLNTLTGWSVDWFKLAWCSLASCGFATMSWLFGYRFLIPAFQMYFTGLLTARFPEWAYVLNGVSWCAALQFIGRDLTLRRSRLLTRNARLAVEAQAESS